MNDNEITYRDEVYSRVGRLRSSLIGNQGVFLFGTGVVLFHESKAFFDRAVTLAESGNSRSLLCWYTVAHETVHMVQWLTSSFLFNHVYRKCLFANLLNQGKRVGASSIEFARIQDEYHRDIEALTRKTKGVSALDLIEAQAVIEGMNGAFGIQTPNAFDSFCSKHIRRASPGSMTPIDAVRHALGSESAYFLTPKLCFLALNTADPAVAFWAYLRRIRVSAKKVQNDAPFTYVLSLLNLSAEEMGKPLDHRSPELRKLEICKNFLNNYFDALGELESHTCLLEYFAHPGAELSEEASKVAERISPPLAIFSDNRFLLLGLARDWNWVDAENLMKMAEVVSEAVDELHHGRP